MKIRIKFAQYGTMKLVNASSSGNIKPTMIFDKFCQYVGIDIPPDLSIKARLIL